MATSKPSKDSFSNETTRICRNCLSTDGTFQPVTSDERGEYLSQQVFSCTNVQLELLPGFTTYLCSACKSWLDLIDKRRSIYILNSAKLDRVMKEVDTTHLTGSETTAERSDGDIEQTNDVKSVVKTEAASEDSEEDYQLSQTVSNSQQMSSAHDYNLLNDLFEAEEESLQTILKREPIDDQQQPQSPQANLIQEDVSMIGKATTGPDDPASISDHNNLGIKYATEGPTLNQMDTYGEQKSGHTGNQPVSVIGEQRLLRSNKRRTSQKDIAAAEFSVATMQSPKVTRNVHKNKQKHQCPHCSVTYPNTSKLKIHIRTHNRKKPFICKVCSKAFHTANILRYHIQIHKDQHKCPHCPRKFPLQYQLKNHIRTHTDEKPFTCKVCSKAFHSAKSLCGHMKIHKPPAPTGENS
ncbi:zinc finger protein 420-like [Anopheles bellator]|uniref:zinc finger protein 420-like n=1 Tax=Anopheles bellator TaxID=139047 RepID=UPI002648618F|nr:zinc finger protein 420-like [Anopheles bellator]